MKECRNQEQMYLCKSVVAPGCDLGGSHKRLGVKEHYESTLAEYL